MNNTVNTLFRDLPATWTSVQARVSFAPTANWQQAGLAVYGDDDNFVYVTRNFNFAQRISMVSETDQVPHIVAEPAVAATRGILLRLQRPAGSDQVTGAYSVDGTTWTTLGTTTADLTSPRLALITGASPGGLPLATYHDVTITASDDPGLAVSTTQLSATTPAGGTVGDLSFEVTNAGSGTLSWTATTDQGWLSVSPSSGTGAGTVTVHVDADGLVEGTHTGTVTVTAPGAGSPVSVGVSVRVLPAGVTHLVLDYANRAELVADGWDFTARTASGGSRDTEVGSGAVVQYSPDGVKVPADAGDVWAGMNNTVNTLFRDLPATWTSVQARVSFAPTANWQQAGLAVYGDDDNFVYVTRNFNFAQRISMVSETDQVPHIVAEPAVAATRGIHLRLQRPAGSDQVTGAYSVDATTWTTLGTTTADLTSPRLALITGASPGGLPLATYHDVTVTASTQPVLAVSRAQLAASVPAGGSKTDSFTVSNEGTGTLAWTASVTQGAAWLSVSPSSGTGPGTVEVSIDADGLPAGAHQGTIVVAAPGATGSPVTIPVALDVLGDGTTHLVLDYAGRAELLADGWDFTARTASGGSRDTEVGSGAVVQYSPDGVKVPADAGDVWAGMNNTVNTLFRDLPATWTSVQARVSFAPTANWQQAGLAVYGDDDNFVYVTRNFNFAQRISMVSETDQVPVILAEPTVSATQGILLRLQRASGDTITGSYSVDGTTWTTLGTTTADLTNPRLALITGASPGGLPLATYHDVTIT